MNQHIQNSLTIPDHPWDQRSTGSRKTHLGHPFYESIIGTPKQPNNTRSILRPEINRIEENSFRISVLKKHYSRPYPWKIQSYFPNRKSYNNNRHCTNSTIAGRSPRSSCHDTTHIAWQLTETRSHHLLCLPIIYKLFPIQSYVENGIFASRIYDPWNWTACATT